MQTVGMPKPLEILGEVQSIIDAEKRDLLDSLFFNRIWFTDHIEDEVGCVASSVALDDVTLNLGKEVFCIGIMQI